MGGQDDVICKDDLASSIKTVDCKDKPDQQLGDSTKQQAHFAAVACRETQDPNNFRNPPLV